MPNRLHISPVDPGGEPYLRLAGGGRGKTYVMRIRVTTNPQFKGDRVQLSMHTQDIEEARIRRNIVLEFLRITGFEAGQEYVRGKTIEEVLSASQ